MKDNEQIIKDAIDFVESIHEWQPKRAKKLPFGTVDYMNMEQLIVDLKSLSKTQANPEDLSANKDFTATPKPCPQCEGHGRIYVYPDDNADATICYKCEGTGKAS